MLAQSSLVSTNLLLNCKRKDRAINQKFVVTCMLRHIQRLAEIMISANISAPKLRNQSLVYSCL